MKKILFKTFAWSVVIAVILYVAWGAYLTDIRLNVKRYGIVDTYKATYLDDHNTGQYQMFKDPLPTSNELEHLTFVSVRNEDCSVDPWGYRGMYFTAHVWQLIGGSYVNVGSVEGWIYRGYANTDQMSGRNIVSGTLPKNKLVNYQLIAVQRLDVGKKVIQTDKLITIDPPMLIAKRLSDIYTQQALTHESARSGEIVSYVVSEQQPTAPLASK
ncbi:MAG: hypothetical protein V4524_01500 [Patescibacteria group bacterium]